MSSGALAQRRHGHAHDGDAIVEVFAEPARRDLGAQVAVGGRDDAHGSARVASSRPPGAPTACRARAAAPAARRAPARRSRRGTACRRRPLRRRPGRSVIAPVNAPRTWPNSADSISSSGTAPQSNTMNGPSLRGLWRWISSASSSLPVPVSPSISTVASVAATSSSTRNSRRSFASRPTSEPKLSFSDGARSTSSSSGRYFSTVLPIVTSVPKASVSSLKREPCTNDPLVEPRSRSTSPPRPARCRGACARWSGPTAARRSRRRTDRDGRLGDRDRLTPIRPLHHHQPPPPGLSGDCRPVQDPRGCLLDHFLCGGVGATSGAGGLRGVAALASFPPCVARDASSAATALWVTFSPSQTPPTAPAMQRHQHDEAGRAGAAHDDGRRVASEVDGLGEAAPEAAAVVE